MTLDKQVQATACQAVEQTRQLLINVHKIAAHRLHDATNNRLDDLPDFERWVFVLSFMTRKIGALYLGSKDFDYGVSDFNFSFQQSNTKNRISMLSQANKKEYLTEYEVLDLFNVSLPRLYFLVQEDGFPKPKEIVGKGKRYLLSEILDWKRSKENEVF